MYVINAGGGNEIRYNIKNSRVIELYTDSLNVLEEIEPITGRITKLTVGNYELSVKDEFKHSCTQIPSPYKIEEILRGADSANIYKHRYSIQTHRRNMTTTYILPCLGRSAKYFDVDGYMINTYLDSKLNRLYLVYRFAETDYYGKLETRLLECEQLVKVDTSDLGLDVFICDIPEEYLQDVKFFKQGKYSKLSKPLKLQIKKFYGLSEKSNLWKILTKDKNLIKKFEVELGLPLGFFWDVDLENKPKMDEELWKSSVEF